MCSLCRVLVGSREACPRCKASPDVFLAPASLLLSPPADIAAWESLQDLPRGTLRFVPTPLRGQWAAALAAEIDSLTANPTRLRACGCRSWFWRLAAVAVKAMIAFVLRWWSDACPCGCPGNATSYWPRRRQRCAKPHSAGLPQARRTRGECPVRFSLSSPCGAASRDRSDPTQHRPDV